MNPFAGRFAHNQSWVLSISAMSLILGLMIGMARVTGKEVSQSRFRLVDEQQQGRLAEGPIDLHARFSSLSQEVNNLREENTKLQNLLAKRSDAAKALNQSLQQAKVVAGLTELQGSGVLVQLQDSQKSRGAASRITDTLLAPPVVDQVIHDQDVLRVVNELYAAGAEAMSINDIRLGPTSSIRCVGPVVLIDGVKVASPIRILAIGDPNTMLGALNLPGGVLEELRSVDEEMAIVQAKSHIKLAAYSGPTTRRYAAPPKDEP